MDFIKKQLTEVERAQAGLGSDMKEVSFLFREEADGRAKTQEKRQREEREEPVLGKALSATLIRNLIGRRLPAPEVQTVYLHPSKSQGS